MRFSHCILIALLAHAILLCIPIRLKLGIEPTQLHELRLIILDGGNPHNTQKEQTSGLHEAGADKISPIHANTALEDVDKTHATNSDAKSTQEQEVSQLPESHAAPLHDEQAHNPVTSEEHTAKPSPQKPAVKRKKTAANTTAKGKKRESKPKKPAKPTENNIAKPAKNKQKHESEQNKQANAKPSTRPTGATGEQTADENVKSQGSRTRAVSETAPGQGTDKMTGGSGPLETSFGSAGGPAFRTRTFPKYPVGAKRMGKEGAVHLRLTIDAEGHLLRVEVLKEAGWGFEDEAVRALKHSTFRPAYRNGKPVKCIARLTVRFELRSSQ